MLAEAANLAGRSDVLAALKEASAATGSDFGYLLSTAMRESSLQPQAKSGTSSAAGLFQFVEQTWFGLVKQFGSKHGLGSFANAIVQKADGRFEADSASDRHAILALRNDPQIAALMAGEYANATRSALQSSLGRTVSNGELYAAHFLGPEAACRLIRMSGTQPQACAATMFPEAAAANHAVFYHADGTTKSVQEVYNWALKQPSVPAFPSSETTPETVAVGATPPSEHPATSLPAPNPDVVTAIQFWAATQMSTASLLSSTSLPQGPLAATPDILDLLGSMDDRQKSPPALRKSE